MPLVTVEELAAYVQSDLRRSTAELILGLVDDAIYGHPQIGPRITDPPQRGLRAIALEVARRALLNPANVQSESANGTSVTYATGAGGRGVELTDREVARLRDLVGDGTAYTVDLRDDGLGVMVDPGPAWWDRQPYLGWPP
ncbi:hypothetical protein AB0I61_17335 [Polymorphospora rubra]|uniref:hypothetical protein n=1 Tax=Polymorphospora rubra TaxID=338584 RepID=UPI0033FB296E